MSVEPQPDLMQSCYDDFARRHRAEFVVAGSDVYGIELHHREIIVSCGVHLADAVRKAYLAVQGHPAAHISVQVL